MNQSEQQIDISGRGQMDFLAKNTKSLRGIKNDIQNEKRINYFTKLLARKVNEIFP